MRIYCQSVHGTKHTRESWKRKEKSEESVRMVAVRKMVATKIALIMIARTNACIETAVPKNRPNSVATSPNVDNPYPGNPSECRSENTRYMNGSVPCISRELDFSYL